MSLTVIALFLGSSFSGYSQLTVTNGSLTGLTAEQLVQQILVGAGVTVSNVTFNGSSGTLTSDMIGSFTTAGPATAQLGFTGGIIMTSGTANIAVGPNSSGSDGSSSGTGSDPDLAMLIPGYTIYDKAILEFDFVPISDTIQFRYVFGSEEFFEYCNSTFNDVFGFFVSGPGITGPFSNNSINIALMPGSSNYVTIDNICGSPYSINNAGGTYIEYDGFTVVLTAWCIVQPCQQYHIKLAIGDAGDSAFDSGVFLEENSFSTNGISYNTSYSSNIDTVAVEGCNNAIISFLLNLPAQDTIIINYTIGGSAQEGPDYPVVPDSLIIYPGQDSAGFVITPYSDGINEPSETVIISFVNTICGTLDTIIIIIKDYDVIQVTITPDVYICNGAPANIQVNGSYGYPPLSYMWSTGQDVTSIVVQPSTPTMYYVSVFDACNFASVDSVLVSISNLTSQFTSIDSVTCHDYTDANLGVTAYDGLPDITYLWSTGDTTSDITHLSSGNYTVTVTDGIGCTSVNTITLTNPEGLTISLTPTDENCLMSCNGQVECIITSPPFLPTTYVWNTSPVQTGSTASGLCAGNYIVTVTYSPNFCTVTASADVNTSTLLDATFTADPMQGYVPFNVDFLFTGYGATTYDWDFGDGTSSTDINPSHLFELMSIYDVVLIVNSGAPDYCTDTFKLAITAIQPSSIIVPNIITPNNDGQNDLFSVQSEGIRTFKLVVFNRWGKKVHETEVEEGFSSTMVRTDLWDGTNMGGGGVCSDGVYFYVIEAIGYDTKEYSINGTVTVLR
jgi:gliding motility-associated-like protein